MSSFRQCLAMAIGMVVGLTASSASAQHSSPRGSHHDHGDEEHRLHFSHPLVAESPSPDTKTRVDFTYQRIHDGDEKAREYSINFQGEYAFHSAFSIEVDVPYTWLDPDGESLRKNLNNVEIGAKFANFEFAEYGLLLGYGFEVALPSGDDGKGIGSNNEGELEPFLDFGFLCQDLEIVGFAGFGIPVNQGTDGEVETELGWNFSTLYHATSRVAAIIEFDGETVLSGAEDGNSVVNVSPGVKVVPIESQPLEIGVAVSFPVTGREHFEFKTLVSIFFHF